MNLQCNSVLLFCIGVVLCSSSALANIALHPDIDERVVAITKLIEESPKDAQLLFKRGQLHLQHEEYDDALADFELVLQLDASMDEVHVARASAMLKGGWPKSAIVILDEYIRLHHDNTGALLLRARALSELENHLAAAKDISHAIKHLKNPTPDQYIELAKEYMFAGDATLEKALQSIDAGIKHFGPLVTLQFVGIEVEQKLGRVDQALHRLDTIAAQSQRKERFLLHRGAILEVASRNLEAEQAYISTLQAIQKLPLRHQNTKAILAIKAEAEQALAGLLERAAENTVPSE